MSHANGSKLWRYKYRYLGKQKRLALGRYPDVGLADARRRRDDARRMLDAGGDPLAERKHEKLVAAYKAANSFSDGAKEYIDKTVAEGRADTTTTKANWLLEQLKPLAPPRSPTSSRWMCWPRSSASRRKASTKARAGAGDFRNTGRKVFTIFKNEDVVQILRNPALWTSGFTMTEGLGAYLGDQMLTGLRRKSP